MAVDATIGVGDAYRQSVTRRRSSSSTAHIHHTMRDWATLAPEPKVGPLNLEDFPYQIEPFYSDEVADLEEVVYLKSTQVGASAGSWRWGMRRAQQYGDTVVYIFPTSDHVTDFGDTRIEPAIEASPFLKRQIPSGHVRKKALKRIGMGWLYLRGSNSKAGAQSVDADVVVFDEYNHLDPSNVPQIERRLSGARQAGRIPRVRRLGIPTGPGEGIDAVFTQSDQRRWHVTCPECQDEQPLDWWKNVRWLNPGQEEVMRSGKDVFANADEVEKAWRACRSCEASLEGVIRTGRWIATQPHRQMRGYHITRLVVPRCDLAQMVKSSRKTKPSEVIAFFNNDLGIAFASTESQLDEDAITAACSHGGDIVSVLPYKPGIFRTAGIDVAGERDINVRISEQSADLQQRRAIYIGTCRDFDELHALLVRYQVTQFAIDGNPERRMARGLIARLPGRGVLVEYGDPRTAPSFAYNPLQDKVTVNRTEAIDGMMDSIRMLRNIPLRSPPPGYIEQLMAPRRRVQIDKKERVIRVYVSVGPDDYAHAEVYDLVATEMLRLRLNAGEILEADEREVSDEELGIQRGRFDSPETGLAGGYDPGFGGV